MQQGEAEMPTQPTAVQHPPTPPTTFALPTMDPTIVSEDHSEEYLEFSESEGDHTDPPIVNTPNLEQYLLAQQDIALNRMEQQFQLQFQHQAQMMMQYPQTNCIL